MTIPKPETGYLLNSHISWAESELSRLLTWIGAAESRLRRVQLLSTAMLGALSILAPAFPNWTVLSSITASFASLLLVLSIVFAACASFPRTTGPKGSMIYFGGISDRDLNQYEEAFKSLTPESYLDDLLRQCHRNAQIARQKFVWVQRSMACLFLGSLPWIIALFSLYATRP